MQRGDVMYYARILPPVFDLCELFIRTVDDGWFAGVDKKDGVAHLFNDDDIGKIIFESWDDALEVLQREESKYKEDIE